MGEKLEEKFWAELDKTATRIDSNQKNHSLLKADLDRAKTYSSSLKNQIDEKASIASISDISFKLGNCCQYSHLEALEKKVVPPMRKFETQLKTSIKDVS